MSKVKYLADIVITNKVSGSARNIEKKFADRIDAIMFVESTIDHMSRDEYSHWHKVVPVLKCRCGATIYCSEFTNTCDECGSDYNFNGDLLAPREQWGYETGERWYECY
jgi:hypothetical protein